MNDKPLDKGAARTSSPKGTQTLLRGLDALQCVADGITEAGAIAAALGVPRSTAHRLLSGLVSAGYLHNIPYQGYTLGPELIFLGAKAIEQRPLISLAEPLLQDLADQTRDTVHFGVPEGDEVFYLSKINATRGGLEMRSKVGQRMPMAFTGIGKAMLFAMPENRWRSCFDRCCAMQANHPERIKPRPWPVVRDDLKRSLERGYTFDMEENEIGIRCVAAPVFDIAGTVVAAISVASAVSFMPEERMEELAPQVLKASRAISRALGWRADNEQ
ncbi:IclR family transcriptional regulator [Martelella mangrovi]|uniref:DNA-binding IclR family transcriptional regulator n=1 Tax=Martelella mangrovi TaxID=1397477 RepID=A0ABV2ID20_9HYPH